MVFSSRSNYRVEPTAEPSQDALPLDSSNPINIIQPFLAMPRVYLLGGENVARRSSREINLAAFEDAAPHPRVLVFTWARPSFDRRFDKRRLFSDYMRSLGAKEVAFVEYEEEEDLAQRLLEADLVYLTGGQASVLVERAEKAGLGELLEGFCGVVVGRSAGALALCSRCVTTIRENKRVRLVDGLGLVDITLKAHYASIKDEALNQISRREPIYAVPKDSALVCSGGELTALGEVYLFQDGKRRIFV